MASGGTGRQENSLAPAARIAARTARALVAAEIIQDDDVAWPKRWDETFSDVETEGLGRDRTVENHGASGHAVAFCAVEEASWN